MPKLPRGHIHPTTQLLTRAISAMEKIGFEVLTGPELTTERLNFDVLRIPKDHPARDTQDTFWTKDGKVLRTHTSAMQIPAMAQKKPPVRILIPGRVFRNESTDATHEAVLYQLEGFVIEKDTTMANLIWTLNYLLKELLGKDIKTKFFPHNYPFVEPGMDVMIKWQGRWLEVLGSGMIHPEVLHNMGVESDKWQGFAFGIGIDRLMMLERGVDDIRWSLSGDLRFLKQF
ncbi:MAG TPA: phenylalanine--tRNA ligase subunit alpha [bacterium]|jgi:phenylalanyl-tRNA synthetase alpha chain|nr:phenylalanine--tRNA ligase subunit alpha [bacterium]HOR57507.1 phenylalanine--tRNA ligase subunit alpha [bacterium]HPL55925.1 phenylalanine--tRNA ligase subunit alpha [bacterium]HPM27771.1 phenylalanine--tRNA ligase subunit alpha [bacterium]